jgi:hypothetical protein
VLKKTEKALQRVKVEAHGTTIPLSLTIPADAQKVCGVAIAMKKLAEEDNNPLTSLRDLFGRSGHDSDVRSALFAIFGSPQNVVTGAAIEADAAGTTPASIPAAEPLPPPREVTSPPYPGPAYLSSAEQLTPARMHIVAPQFGPSIVGHASPVKLAIGNLSKEPALLFLEAEGGKLTFQKKVPPGEAIDVETTPGQRWIAIFADNPVGETFVTATDKTTWLLRCAPLKAPRSVTLSPPEPMSKQTLQTADPGVNTTRSSGPGRFQRSSERIDGKPTYILEGASEAFYVIAESGVNLENYVGKDVELLGQFVPHPEYRIRTLSAKSVVPLRPTITRP